MSQLAAITGGGSGLGAAIAHRLAADHYAIAVIDINESAAQETVRALQSADVQAAAFVADSSKAAQLGAAVSAAVNALGPLEVMVNNAGVLDGYFDVDEMDESLWRRVIDIDLTGVYLGSKRALEEMLPRGRGRIINMASVAGLNGTGGGAAYIAAKHGVVGLTKALAMELGPAGVRVVAVAPAMNETPGLQEQRARYIENSDAAQSFREMEQKILATIPLRRFGQPDDVARVALFAASDLAAFVTATTVFCDGGVSAF